MGSYSFTVNKTTAAQSIACYAKITSNSSYVSGTKTSSTVNVAVSAKTSYTVSYNANGGSGAPSAQTKWHGTTLKLSDTKPTRTGYTFKGWATSSGGSVAYASGANYTANAGATLYAVWQVITYTISYNANGGSGAPGNQTKTHGTALTLSSTKPTRANYNFKGWATSASATSAAYAAGGSYTTNAAATLYAVWELAYIKPRVENLIVQRCNSGGTVTSNGTYALVKFSWATDKTVSSIAIKWRVSGTTTYSGSATVSASGTSGTVSKVIGAGELSPDSPYDIQVIVADASGNTPATKTLEGTAFPIDIAPGGNAVAIGKEATVDGAFDIYMQTIIRGNEDASGTVASGQLIIGDPNSAHIAMDNNEIMAKTNATTPGNISINYEGGDVGLGSDNGDISLRGNTFLYHGKTLYGMKADGSSRSMVQFNASNQAFFGYGGYSSNEGESYFDGNAVNIRSKGAIAITSSTAGLSARQYGVNKVLWSGGYYMTETHTATLSEAISAQPNGIVLVWSYYANGAIQKSHYVHFFVPKKHVETYPGTGSVFRMYRHGILVPCSKYLYINNTTITGHSANATSTSSLASIEFVLTEVYGV
jgi:uncharacterized repeat protein (TIGR02543 family)